MKKNILIIMVLFIILIIVSVFIFGTSDRKEQELNDIDASSVNSIKDNTNEEELPIGDDASESKDENDAEEEVVEDQKSSVPNDNNKTNTEDNNSGKESNNQNTLNSNESNEKQQDTTLEEVVEKTVCSNDDSGYQSFLANYKSMYPAYFTFNSESEAIAFGEKAMTEFGYMYQRNTLPVIYNGDNCTKEVWYVRLTIAARACTKDGVYNDVIHIPATSMDLVSTHDYLRLLGYDCGNKR